MSTTITKLARLMETFAEASKHNTTENTLPVYHSMAVSCQQNCQNVYLLTGNAMKKVDPSPTMLSTHNNPV
jgi:hypothetical protein